MKNANKPWEKIPFTLFLYENEEKSTQSLETYSPPLFDEGNLRKVNKSMMLFHRKIRFQGRTISRIF